MPSSKALFFGLLVLLLALPGGRPRVVAAQASPCFDETGFCIDDPAIVDFFWAHGAQSALGFPISREFRLRGSFVQLFQRVGVRIGPDGQAAALELLDDDLLPLRHLNGSVLPPPDPALLSRAPRADRPDFPSQAGAFLQAEVPDSFDGRPVGFLRTYLAAAGTDGDAARAEAVFGWPTSRPTPDPGNPDFVYQRFERAILRHSTLSGLSQPLLLGDSLKSVLTGRDLPADLEADVHGGPLLRQYSPFAADGLQRPTELPDSNLADAFRRSGERAPELLQPPGFGPENGWPSGQDEPFGPLPDGYLVEVQQPGNLERGASAAVSNLQPLDDFALVVDARLAEAGSAGYALQLRRESDDDHFTLILDPQRRVASFYRRSAGQTTVLWDWSPVESLRAGTEPNRLTIRAVGPRFAAWVNGQRLFDLEAPGPARGSLWLAAVTWGDPARVIFSNLRIVAPE